ncbi:MAG: hypothetical protein WKG07_19125 [Hymenobacter sp.]
MEGSSAALLTITASTASRHTVWLDKPPRPVRPSQHRKITGAKLKALPAPTRPAHRVHWQQHHFAGPPPTLGSTPGTGEYHDQTNAYQAYGLCVARALNLNYILSSMKAALGPTAPGAKAAPPCRRCTRSLIFVDNLCRGILRKIHTRRSQHRAGHQ